MGLIHQLLKFCSPVILKCQNFFLVFLYFKDWYKAMPVKMTIKSSSRHIKATPQQNHALDDNIVTPQVQLSDIFIEEGLFTINIYSVCPNEGLIVRSRAISLYGGQFIQATHYYVSFNGLKHAYCSGGNVLLIRQLLQHSFMGLFILNKNKLQEEFPINVLLIKITPQSRYSQDEAIILLAIADSDQDNNIKLSIQVQVKFYLHLSVKKRVKKRTNSFINYMPMCKIYSEQLLLKYQIIQYIQIEIVVNKQYKYVLIFPINNNNIYIIYRMIRNDEESLNSSSKLNDKKRKRRESQPLTEENTIDIINKITIPLLHIKRKNDVLSKFHHIGKRKDISITTPSTTRYKGIQKYHTQNYFQHQQFMDSSNKLISQKEQINKSIITIQNILKNGINSKQCWELFKKQKRCSEKVVQQKQKKQQKPLPYFLKKHSKEESSKGFLLETMSSNHPKINLKNRIQDFIYIKELGRGKFGVVSLALHKKTKFLFAIKAMSKQSIISENNIEQIIREVKIQQFLTHPNIVKLFDIFDDHDHLYLVMEYCNGGQFYHILERKGKIQQKIAKVYVKQICQGVAQLHKYGIIHRDLKPQNMVLNFDMLKLCDFGWSIASKNSMRSTFCGTPLYVSPELLGGNNYDEKIDLWAIGIITFEMLTGENPFRISSKRQLGKIISSEIRYPSEISSQAKSFIMALLEKDPQNRATISQILHLPFLKPQISQTQMG